MHGEVERVWGEVLVTYFETLLQISTAAEESHKSTVRMLRCVSQNLSVLPTKYKSTCSNAFSDSIKWLPLVVADV